MPLGMHPKERNWSNWSTDLVMLKSLRTDRITGLKKKKKENLETQMSNNRFEKWQSIETTDH